MTRKIILATMLVAGLASCRKDNPVEVKKTSYVVPGDRFFPEGIAYNPATGIFYTGSTTNGDIAAINVQTGTSEIISSGAKQGRTFCTGMKLDSQGRLWVCGGQTGKVFALKTDGSLIRSWDLATTYGAGFINDCIADKKYMYFTDSQVKNIYRTGITGEPGDIEKWLTFSDAQIPYAAGTNANGIEITPDGKYLIIVVSSSGKLYRVGIADKSITEIQLSEPVASGDGILLDNTTLYVSRNATNKIFPVQMMSDYTKGTVGAGFGENLLFNTTLAKAGKYLLVVNAQLNKRTAPAVPELPFTVARVPLP